MPDAINVNENVFNTKHMNTHTILMAIFQVSLDLDVGRWGSPHGNIFPFFLTAIALKDFLKQFFFHYNAPDANQQILSGGPYESLVNMKTVWIRYVCISRFKIIWIQA